MDKIKEKIMNQLFFNELYSDFGSTNVHLDEWVQKNGYQERTIYYNKLLIIPIFGKKLLNLSENQKMFDMKNKIGIFVKSNLGDTPFHECFDPQVQLIFENQRNSVEFLCYLDVVWTKSCAVKSIIQSQTTSSTKEIYELMGKKLIDLFGGVDKSDANDEITKFQDDFGKTRKLYKLSIILLLIILIITCNIKYRNKYSKNIIVSFLTKIAVLIFNLLLIVF